MEEKLALVHCLSIFNCETVLLEETGRHNDLIRRTIGTIRLPELVGDGDDRSVLIFFKRTIINILDNGVTFNAKQILQNMRISCPYDNATHRALESILSEELTTETAKKHITEFANHLNFYLSKQEAKKIVQKAAWSFDSDGDNYKDIITNLREQLSRYEGNQSSGEEGSFVARVGLDRDGLVNVFNETKKELEGAVLKTPWKRLNKMLGIKEGLTPGEMFTVPALPHNAKTTFTLALTIGICMFNQAADFVEEGKKAMILDISLENELNQNLPVVYKMIKEYETGVYVDLKAIDPETASDYILERLRKNGWHYVFERHINSDFSIETFRNVVERYERDGYHIVLSRIDYLGVANKTGLGNGAIGSEVKETYRRARNLAARRKMTIISPHQLSPAAKSFKAIEPIKFIRELPGRGLYDGCTSIDNEVDGELFIGITNGYLEIQRGKHRTLIDTPINLRYCVIKFNDIGVLPWDVEKDYETTLPSIAADSMREEEDDFLLGGF